ncbi:MAG: hypothetical protein SGPRY_000735, partial [Prymnesium sp.]
MLDVVGQGLSPNLGGTRLGSRQELSELLAGESPQLPCRDREQHRPPTLRGTTRAWSTTSGWWTKWSGRRERSNGRGCLAPVSRLSRIRSVHETWCSRSALGSPLRESWKARATHNLSSVPRAFGGRKEGVSVNSGVPAGGKALPGMPSVQSYAMAQAVCDLAVRPADSDASTPPGVGVYGIDKEKAYCFLVTQAADHYVTCFYGRIHR